MRRRLTPYFGRSVLINQRFRDEPILLLGNCLVDNLNSEIPLLENDMTLEGIDPYRYSNASISFTI